MEVLRKKNFGFQFEIAIDAFPNKARLNTNDRKGVLTFYIGWLLYTCCPCFQESTKQLK